ncbi:Uncharacterised protein [Vibrio cholerae]|nr:Uncharacterised protein [Vibrio cholerae]
MCLLVWQPKTRKRVARLLMQGKCHRCLVSKRACFTTTLTGLVIWRLRLPVFLTFRCSSRC